MKQYLTKQNALRVAGVLGVIAVVAFVEFVPMGRAIVFAIQNPGVVNSVASQQSAQVSKMQFVLSGPKGE